MFTSQGIIQKKYGHIGFQQSQKRLQLGGQGDALVGGGASNFFFFCIKHAKTVIVRVNIG